MKPDSLSLIPSASISSTADPCFDELAQLAAQFCQTPIAVISVRVSNHHQIKSQLGWLSQDATSCLDFCHWCLQRADVGVIQDILQDEQFASHPLVVAEPGLRFYAGCPLMSSSGLVLGCLSVLDYAPRSLTLEQISALQVIGRQVAMQLELQLKPSPHPSTALAPRSNPRPLLERTALPPSEHPPKEQAALVPSPPFQAAELIQTVATILGEGGNVAGWLERCCRSIVQGVKLPYIRVWTFNAQTNLLELQVAIGQGSPGEDFPQRIPLGISIIGFIAQNRHPYLTNAVTRDVCMGGQNWLRQQNWVGFAGYPLVVEGRLIGVLAVLAHQPLKEFQTQTLDWFSQTLAVGIDRTWARQELLRRREAILFRLASQIRASLNLDLILNTTVQEIRTLLKIDRCHFLWYYVNDRQSDLVITHEASDPQLPSLLGDCPEQYKPLLITKILNLQTIRVNVRYEVGVEPAVKEMLIKMKGMAQLLMPLETRSNQLGAIVCTHGSPRVWSDPEVELLQAVVDQVAIALDQAELYAKTRADAAAAETQAQKLSEALEDLRQTQAQLVQNEKMSSLGQMVAGIAHEINNPVSFISGNVVYASNYIQDLLKLIQLYQQHYPDPVAEVQDLADQIDIDFISRDLPKLLSSMRIGSDRIREIVLSLRNFSRLDEAEKKPVNLNEGIDSTLLILENRLRASANRVGIQVQKQYDLLPQVECYAGQLNQVFMNILSNAIDALEERLRQETKPGAHPGLGDREARQILEAVEGAEPTKGTTSMMTTFHPVIQVQTQFLAEPVESLDAAESTPKASLAQEPNGKPIAQGVALIRIRDNGIGMDTPTQGKLFDPFFTTKPVGQGTGLGMSISYQIVVQKHGGSLECHSQPGQGTEFVIKIPTHPQ